MKIYSVIYRRKDEDEQRCVDVQSESWNRVIESFYSTGTHENCKIVDFVAQDSQMQILINGAIKNSTRHKSILDRLLKYYKDKHISVTIYEKERDEMSGKAKSKTKN